MLKEKELQKVQKSFTEAKDRMAFIFEALGDSTRLKIFRLLCQKKGLCVTDVANVCGISVPAASYQLKILEIVGLVQREREGKMVCYELREEDPMVKNIMMIIK
ncbi:winged helix-turn-helix transcriptional regulator [Patescibacteria group bacterium]|nr:winged helix-turn-helix transcriptional regulator [Patescibacteria group bacterium]